MDRLQHSHRTLLAPGSIVMPCSHCRRARARRIPAPRESRHPA
ncbi:hypothetical protein CZ771_12955 [Actinomycetales bacterium JB111]|nr:hypothetical protein CZ771_12955 [Actinomycetales bacterium JB111]